MNWSPGTGSGRAGGCGWWCRGLCVLLLVLSVLLVMAGVALYLDPGDSLQVRLVTRVEDELLSLSPPILYSDYLFIHVYFCTNIAWKYSFPT